jgi:hypothetical protein
MDVRIQMFVDVRWVGFLPPLSIRFAIDKFKLNSKEEEMDENHLNEPSEY